MKKISDNIESMTPVEKMRREGLRKAENDWKRLTNKDEWPEEEHEERFNALLRLMLHTPKLP